MKDKFLSFWKLFLSNYHVQSIRKIKDNTRDGKKKEFSKIFHSFLCCLLIFDELFNLKEKFPV